LRIVSLLPSATEIVCALGLESSLVGRSHECDFPTGIERLPVCTSPKVGGRDTREIHASVTAILQHDISVYSVDGALLRELAPTHIVTQIQCDVCAVSLRDVEDALADWSGTAPPRIIALNPQSLDDVFDDIRRTATALDADGEQLAASMQSRMNLCTARQRRAEFSRVGVQHGAAVPYEESPRVVFIEWIEPLMSGGNWMPTLIEMAGGVSLLGKAGEHSAWMTWNELATADPDIIVVAPCGFHIADTQRDWHYLTSNPAWRNLRAVQNGNVHVADGNQFFNRPGPRLVESLDILAEIFDRWRR
jgi:iron complex transport system substrate-binding protein